MDEPQHHEVGRDAQEHVDKLQAQVPNENSGHVSAALVHRLLTEGVVEGSVRDEEHRGIDVGSLHGSLISERGRQRTPARGTEICQKKHISGSVVIDNRQTHTVLGKPRHDSQCQSAISEYTGLTLQWYNIKHTRVVRWWGN